jgi:Ca2+-binding RTX toxin-like protein
MSGFAGSDTIDGGPNIDLLIEQVSGHIVLTDSSMSGLGNDVVTNVELVQLNAGAGNDTLDASAFTFGSVTLSGGAGDDILRGGSQIDSLLGGEGNDSLSGNGGDDLMDGGIGTDWVVETADGLVVLTDTGLVSGLGADTHLSLEHASLIGGTGADTLDASAYTLSPVILHGGDGNDSLIGTALEDSLYGDAGQDVLDGRLGNDSLSGGLNTDTVVAAGDVNFTVTASSLAGIDTDVLAPDVEGVSLTAGASDNVFDLLSWPGNATITAGAGLDLLSVGGSLADDNFLIEAGQIIRGAATIVFTDVEHVSLEGGAGDDVIAIADGLTAETQVVSAPAAATSITHVTLMGGEGDDLIRMKPQASLLVYVDGGPHAVGDTLEYDATNIVLTQFEGQLVPQDHQPVNYINIEFLDLVRQLLNKIFLPFINR